MEEAAPDLPINTSTNIHGSHLVELDKPVSGTRKKQLENALPDRPSNKPTNIPVQDLIHMSVTIKSEMEDVATNIPNTNTSVNTPLDESIDICDSDTDTELDKSTTSEGKVIGDYMDYVPPEILRSYIFSQLDGVSFIRCRRVCKRWKAIADEMLRASLWKDFCHRDYGEAFSNSLKISPDMTWFLIYRNFTAWPRIGTIEKTFHTFPIPAKKIQNIHVTDDGTLVVLQQDAIRFYDIKSMKLCNRHREIEGTFVNYKENYRAINLWGINSSLLITKRRVPTLSPLRNMMMENVRRFFLDKRAVYYCVGKEIFRVSLCTRQMSSELLTSVEGDEEVMDITMYGGRLYVRTSDLAVRAFINSQLVEIVPPRYHTTCVDVMGKYFTVNQGDVICSLENKLRIHHRTRTREITPFPSLTVALSYNNTIIFGTCCGRVLIYKIKDHNSVIDFDPQDIVWQHAFNEDEPEIINITVTECRFGQCLIAATNETVHLVKFLHFPGSPRGSKKTNKNPNEVNDNEQPAKRKCVE